MADKKIVIKKKGGPLKTFLKILLILLLIPITLVALIYILFFDKYRKEYTPATSTTDVTQLALETGVKAFKGTNKSKKIEMRIDESLINSILAKLLKDKVTLPVQNASLTMWIEFAKDGKYNFNFSLQHPIFKTRACATTKLIPYYVERDSSGKITYEGVKFKIENVQIGRINFQKSLKLIHNFIPTQTIVQINTALANSGLNLKINYEKLEITYSYEDMGKDLVKLLGDDYTAETYAALLGVLMEKTTLNNGDESKYLGIDVNLEDLEYLTFKDNDDKNVEFFPKITNPTLSLTYEDLCKKQNAMSKVMQEMNTSDISLDNIADLGKFFFASDYCDKGGKDIRDKYFDTLKKLGYVTQDSTTSEIEYTSEYGKVFEPEIVDLKDKFQEEITKKITENVTFKVKEQITTPIEVEGFDQKGYPIGVSYSDFVDIDGDFSNLKFTVYNTNDVKKMFTSSYVYGVGYSLYAKYKDDNEANETYHLSSIYINDLYTRSVKFNGVDYYCLVVGININGFETQAGIISKYNKDSITDNKLRLYVGETEGDSISGVYYGDIKGNQTISEFLMDLISVASEEGGYNIGGDVIKFSEDYKYIEIDFNQILKSQNAQKITIDSPITFKSKSTGEEKTFNQIILDFSYNITFDLFSGNDKDPNGGINISYKNLVCNYYYSE